MYFIRHGQSLGNQLGVFLGHTDLDLSELGYRQAACTAQYLKDIKIDKVYSSDLLRAENTLKLPAKRLKKPPNCARYLSVSGKISRLIICRSILSKATEYGSAI